MTCHLSDQILNIIVVDEKSNLLVFYKKEKLFQHKTPMGHQETNIST
jgi:hypothetical protein